MRVTDIGTLGPVGPSSRAPATEPKEGVSFGESLNSALEAVEQKNQEANTAVMGMLNGSVDVHEAMIALHEAEESIEITVAIRNKMVQAYQDIMRMPL